ncbi:DUF3500 domain-containing protein [Pseudonocardia spinosispora]|uniref:DUF3500 domain-containing protein n=1 Tax=Pseudonocardia spinosispora TaxID=103441 RepID=UPI0003FCF7D3|nr:DUF3500 domain-containing protein [Pseudonocardia spinosispora]
MLAGLDSGQRERAHRPWSPGSDDERRRWFYTPTDHGGLTVADMTATQYRRTMALVATGLSEAAYVTVATIMGLENVLDHTEGFARTTTMRERWRDPELYYLRIVGTPGEPVWGWRFGGHHVSLNNLVVDGALVSSTPCFLGADPAGSPLLGGTALRPLGGVEDLGRALVVSLDEGQRSAAVLTPRAPLDVVAANRPRAEPGNRVLPLGELFGDRFTDDEAKDRMNAGHQAGEEHYGITEADHDALELTAVPRGISAARLDSDQRALVVALLDCYTGRVPEELRDRESARFAGSLLDEVHFAWAGSDEPGAACYYRLQGPRLLVEYDNAQRHANHAHSVWRDPEGDFGADVLAAHHRAHH